MGQLQIGPYVGCVDITPIHRCNAADQRAGGCAPTFDANGGRTDIAGALVAATARFAQANRSPGQAFGLNGAEPGVGLQAGGYAISATDNRPMTSVAHEVGHLLGRPHAGCPTSGSQVGEPWLPDGVGLVQGIGLDDRPGSGGASAFRILASSPIVTSASCPTATSDCSVSMMPQFTDWMSYCVLGETSSWISTRNWTALMNSMRVGATAPPTGVGSARPPSLRAGSSTTLLVIGHVDGDDARITAVQPGLLGPTPPDTGSPLRIVVRDRNGSVLSSTPTTIHPPSEPGNPSLVNTEVPAPPTSARVELVRDGRVLAARARSAHTPTIKILVPNGKTIGAKGTVTVRWRAADIDGDALTATVQYAADGKHYRAVGVTRASTMRLPAALFARSTRGRIRVIVNDGFSDASAISRRLASTGAAPSVRISYPTDKLTIANDGAITLAGEAHDDAGKAIGGRRLRWYATAKRLGTGARLTVRGLPTGTRRVRLVAIDRFGRRAATSIRLRVFATPPQFTVLRTPARLSRRARTARLRVATAIPATLTVGGRRYNVDRTVRTITIAFRQTASVAVLRLRLHAAGKTTVRIVRIPLA